MISMVVMMLRVMGMYVIIVIMVAKKDMEGCETHTWMTLWRLWKNRLNEL